MAEEATILITEISGFTEFTSTTALDHASHIINELQSLIAEANMLDFTLAEIEGDTVLFYKKEAHPPLEAVISICLTVFQRFHARLRVIERDAICQCDACQTAPSLNLKFIIHHGLIKEIKVAHFVKATGIDMIIARRLLENDIDCEEYIIITQSFVESAGQRLLPTDHAWITADEKYEVVGTIPINYAELTDIRNSIPDPPKIERQPVTAVDEKIEIEINASLWSVYQTLINVDVRSGWMIGVDKINRDPVTERIGMQHTYLLQGKPLIRTAVDSSFSEESALYVERVEIPGNGLDALDIYDLVPQNEKKTLLTLSIDWKKADLPVASKLEMIEGIKSNLASLKQYVESRN